MKKAIMSVISDLSSDQRVHKVSLFLHENNCEVLLVGRKFKDSLPLTKRVYKTERLKCIFKKGVLQYLEFNFRLFWFLIFKKADLYISNDLDTLLPNFIVSKIRNTPLVYDAHEYFTGVPELKNRHGKRKTWKLLEHLILPRVKHSYTVNDSIRELYRKEFGIQMKVVRNLPMDMAQSGPDKSSLLPKDRTIIIMQGAGINPDRGYEEAIRAMEYLPENFLLLIVGNGTIINQLKSDSEKKQLQKKVIFIPKVPYEDLYSYTRLAFLGLSLDKPVSINNEFSLPNKIFDYIRAEVPILSSGLPEIKKILEQFDVGRCIDKVEPQVIARNILEIYNDPVTYGKWKMNMLKALRELNWNKEKPALLEVYQDLIN